MYVSSVGTKSAESFSVNPIVVHMKLCVELGSTNTTGASVFKISHKVLS